MDALESLVGPVDVVLRRPDEEVEQRAVSAPWRSRISCGLTRLPLDFDIFSPPRRIIPWVKSLANGSRTSRHAQVGERLGEEAGVHQVEDRVLDPADVLVDRHPLPQGRRVPRRLVVVRVAEAQEVPGRVDEGVHRVGLAAGRAAAGRAVGRRHASAAASGDWPWGRVLDVVGRSTGSSSSGTGTMPQRVAVDDRDRAAPEALAADQPVAQAVVDLAVAHALALEPPEDRLERLALVHAVELRLLMCGPSPVYGRASPPSGGCTCEIGRPYVVGEVPVALVLGRHRHDRPGAVPHEHVVGEVQRDGSPVNGLVTYGR